MRRSNESFNRSIDWSILMSKVASSWAICSDVLYKLGIIAKSWKLDLNRNLLNKFWQSFNFDMIRIRSHISDRISGGRLSKWIVLMGGGGWWGVEDGGYIVVGSVTKIREQRCKHLVIYYGEVKIANEHRQLHKCVWFWLTFAFPIIYMSFFQSIQ